MGKIRMKVSEDFGKIRLDYAVNEFIRHCRLRNLSQETQKYYQEDLNYFCRVMELIYADEVDSAAIERFIEHEMDKGNRIAAINSRIRGIRVFVRFCAEREYLEGFKIAQLKEDQEQKEPYTDAELKRLLKKPKSDKWQEWRCWAIVNLLLATGIRANTVIHLKISDVNFQDDTIFLSKLKNRRQQTIPISTSLKNVLKLYLSLWEWKQDDYLFPTVENTQMKKGSLQCAIRAYNKSRGVTKTSLHLFRHTFAKNYILAGGGMVQLQAILGHTTLDMTRKYVNLYSKDIHQDFNRLNPLNNVLMKV